MKLILTSLLSIIFFLSFAQTSNFIEVAVEETIELAPKSVTVNISVQSIEEQRDRLYRNQFDFTEYADDDDYYYEEGYEEDYIYEQMLEDSPKKITKEMTKEYEERQQKQKERRELREKRERDFEKKWENHKKVTSADVHALIKELKIKSEIIKQTNERYEEYFDDYEEYSDSIIEVTVTNAEDWDRLNAALEDLPIDTELEEVIHQSADDQLATAIPSLTVKAKNQAQLIASSLGRKLGKVMECTNIYPFTPSKSYLGTYSNELERILYRQELEGNPYKSTKKEIIQLIYKFELLN